MTSLWTPPRLLILLATACSGCHHAQLRTQSSPESNQRSATFVQQTSPSGALHPPLHSTASLSTESVDTVDHSAANPPVILAAHRVERTTLFQDASQVPAKLGQDVPSIAATKDNNNRQEKSPTDRTIAAPAQNLTGVADAVASNLGSITLEQILTVALTNSPSIRQAEAAVAKAEGVRYQVGLRPNPMVGYNGTQLADQKTEQHTVFVSQDIVTAQKLQRNTNVHGFEVENLKWQAEGQRRAVRGDIKQLFFDALGTQQKLELSKQFVEMADKAADVSRQRKKAGEGTEVDVLQSEVQLQQVTVANRQANAALSGTWNRLAATAGEPNMPLVLLDGQLPVEPIAYQWDAEYTRICSESPDLMAARTRVARARANLDRQRVQATPNISWMVGAGYDRGTDSQLINTQLGLPLPINNQNEGNQSAAQAEYCRSIQEVRRIELFIKAQLASTSQAYDSAASSVTLYKTAVIPRAEKMLELAEMTYKAGEIDFLQVLTIRRTYFDSMFEYLTSRTQLAQAGARIEELLLSGSLDNSTDSNFDDGLRGQTFSGQ